MRGQHSVFLTREEVVAAIHTDLQQYDPQPDLLCDLYPVVMGAGAVAVEDTDPRRVWITQAVRGPMRPISCDDLTDTLFDRLASGSPSMDSLANLCTRVFDEPARAGFDRRTRTKGIWLETGMGGYACRQCGQCCRTLDYHRECARQDYRRWQALGRDDILEWVRRVPGPAGKTTYRIWVAPGTEEPAAECPFLQNETGPDRYYCGIHDVKPGICRQYPFTRKHALMTGCPGFNRD